MSDHHTNDTPSHNEAIAYGDDSNPKPYTTEEDDSDIIEIEISSTSTFDRFEGYNVANTLKKSAEGHSKMSEGYYELFEALPILPKNLIIKALHQLPGPIIAKIPIKQGANPLMYRLDLQCQQSYQLL